MDGNTRTSVTKTLPRTGPCKIKGCGGTVGKLLPIPLSNVTDDDGKVCQAFWAHPCDQCGALYGSAGAQGLIENEDECNVFAQGRTLVFKDQEGRVVKKDGSHIWRDK